MGVAGHRAETRPSYRQPVDQQPRVLPQVSHQPAADLLVAGEVGGDEADEQRQSRDSDDEERHL